MKKYSVYIDTYKSVFVERFMIEKHWASLKREMTNSKILQKYLIRIVHAIRLNVKANNIYTYITKYIR